MKKNKSFKLRSGNGVQFKQMGSSPAKKFAPDDFKSVLGNNFTVSDSKNLQKDKLADVAKDAALSSEGTKESLIKDMSGDHAGRGDSKEGLHKDQIKAQDKLKKIQDRQDKKAYKKFSKKMNLDDSPEGQFASFDEWKKSDDYTNKESGREKRLNKKLSMTGDEYTKHKEAKKAEFKEAMTKAGYALSAYGEGGSGSMTRNIMEYDKMKADAEQQKKDNYSQSILDKLRQQKLDLAEVELSGKNDLDNVENQATNSDENGDPTANLESTSDLVSKQTYDTRGDQYKDYSEDEYKKEAKRQQDIYDKTGKWDYKNAPK